MPNFLAIASGGAEQFSERHARFPRCWRTSKPLERWAREPVIGGFVFAQTTGTAKMLSILIWLLLSSIIPASAWASEKYGVWFSPDGASPDLVDLFRQPERWNRARSHIDVFKFGPMRLTRSVKVDHNSYEELKDVDAFRKLHDWGIKIASEEGAIKPWDCTGVQAVKVTEGHIRNVHAAGGSIDIIAMDEPLASGRQQCGLTVTEAARRMAAYAHAVLSSDETKAGGGVSLIGDIEPYPFFSVNDLKAWTDDLAANDFTPAFFHIDINVHFVDVHPDVNLKGDLKLLQAFFSRRRIPFGIILWSGYDPLSSDKIYYDHVIRLVHDVREAVRRPDQVIFQSWVMRAPEGCTQSDHSCASQPCSPSDPPYCGKNSIPLNLPENDPAIYSHTRVINDALAAFNAK
jgi:hypothetical protein